MLIVVTSSKTILHRRVTMTNKWDGQMDMIDRYTCMGWEMDTVIRVDWRMYWCTDGLVNKSGTDRFIHENELRCELLCRRYKRPGSSSKQTL